jgi:hypothetical protein
MLRRVLAIVGAAAGAVLLSGCGPEVLPLAGVTVDDAGSPRLLVRPCGDAAYTAPALTGWAGSWEDEPSEDETEQRLLPDHTYAFAFYAHTDDQVNGAVTFTGSDLAKLKPGRVWADDRVMSAKEFEERTERAC